MSILSFYYVGLKEFFFIQIKGLKMAVCLSRLHLPSKHTSRQFPRQTACKMTNKVVYKRWEALLWHREVCLERNRRDILRNPIKQLTGWAASQDSMAKFPEEAEESGRFTGQSALLHRYRTDKMMVCRGEDFPWPHHLHNYSHWGVWGRKLSIWEVSTHEPVCCTRARLWVWWSVQIPHWPALINALCVRLPLVFFQGTIASISTQDKIKK